TERIGKIVALKGKKQSDIKKITAGDIAVITKINANTTDTLCAPSRVVKVSTQEFAKPCYFRTIVAKGKGDEGKISQGIQRLLEEDLTLSYEVSTETNEQILGGLGEQHLDVAAAKLKSKFGVEIDLLAPKIAYRETIRNKVKVEGKHKKQTGGHGQYGHVWIEFEPHDGEELIFEEKVFGGSVPKNFFPAVEKGLQDSAKKGVLAGFPVVGLKATLLDGSYHPVDSSEMAFKMAASIAYREGMKKATPWILEPIGKLKVIVSDVNTGDMMGDLNKRRGRVVGMNPYKNNLTEIEADVPIAEMQDFAMAVRQMTQGMGSFTLEFDRYEMLPANLQEELISQVSDQ
ncbi:MAG: elongation factor G, partial [Clostridiales bacterium]|nr:elongation factor G [Clostridiales bacterium]